MYPHGSQHLCAEAVGFVVYFVGQHGGLSPQKVREMQTLVGYIKYDNKLDARSVSRRNHVNLLCKLSFFESGAPALTLLRSRKGFGSVTGSADWVGVNQKISILELESYLRHSPELHIRFHDMPVLHCCLRGQLTGNYPAVPYQLDPNSNAFIHSLRGTYSRPYRYSNLFTLGILAY